MLHARSSVGSTDAERFYAVTRVLTVGNATDIKSTPYAGRAYYEELLGSEVRIYEYRATMMHAKTLVMDGMWGAVGSMNADNRSMSFNEETMFVMLDTDLGSKLEQQFHDDLASADEVDLATFRKRPILDRLKERTAHRVRCVL